MTNKERVEALIGFSPNSDNSVYAALLDRGLNADDQYDPLNSVTVKRATIEVMYILLTTANTSDSASSFSVTYDRNAILERIKALTDEIGDPTGPTIRRVTKW
jgi:hypothetical protein